VHKDHQVRYYAKAFPAPLSDREFLTSTIHRKIDDDTVVWVCSPTIIPQHQTPKTRHGRVRGDVLQYCKLTRIGLNESQIDYYAMLNMGGFIPNIVINQFFPRFMSVICRRQEHFQHLRKLAELTAVDGRRMAIMLKLKSRKKESLEEWLDEFANINVALKEFLSIDHKSNPVYLRNLILAVLINKTSVDNVVKQHKLEHIFSQHKFFEPFLETLSKQLKLPTTNTINPAPSLTPETGKKLGIALTTKHADESINQRINFTPPPSRPSPKLKLMRSIRFVK